MVCDPGLFAKINWPPTFHEAHIHLTLLANVLLICVMKKSAFFDFVQRLHTFLSKSTYRWELLMQVAKPYKIGIEAE